MIKCHFHCWLSHKLFQVQQTLSYLRADYLLYEVLGLSILLVIIIYCSLILCSQNYDFYHFVCYCLSYATYSLSIMQNLVFLNK